MRTGRALIIPAILSLGLVGSTVAGTAMPVATGHVVHIKVLAHGQYSGSHVYYHS
jgi:hypothetical protein